MLHRPVRYCRLRTFCTAGHTRVGFYLHPLCFNTAPQFLQWGQYIMHAMHWVFIQENPFGSAGMGLSTFAAAGTVTTSLEQSAPNIGLCGLSVIRQVQAVTEDILFGQ